MNEIADERMNRDKIEAAKSKLVEIQNSIPERFREMTLDEIRQERLISRGLADENTFK